MGANSFGHYFRVHSFGESHGPALGVLIDGMPAGLEFNKELLVKFLERRRPAQSAVVSSRKETDLPEILSGIYEGKTLGTPIAVLIRNTDVQSHSYENVLEKPRQGHADDLWRKKFGWSDPRGGGRASGRETVSRVIAGAFAQMFVQFLSPQTQVKAWAKQIGPFQLSPEEIASAKNLSASEIDQIPARFGNPFRAKEVEELLIQAKENGKSYGGEAQLFIEAPPSCLGQPVFHKLKADFAAAFLSVGATCSLDMGDGRDATFAEGSIYHRSEKANYGGIRGGLSTGEAIDIRIGFKPTSSVLDFAKKGRHDPCIVPRAIPVLEAMAWLVLADHLLAQRTDKVL